MNFLAQWNCKASLHQIFHFLIIYKKKKKELWLNSCLCKWLKLHCLINVGICKLKNMQELDLSENKIVGQFPLCITSMTGLRILDLSSNQLIGNVPSALGNLESLEYLSLFDNNFEGLLTWFAYQPLKA